MSKTIFFVLILVSSSFANYQNTYPRELIKTDFEKQNTSKYKADTIPLFSLKNLIDKKVFSTEQKLIRSFSGSSYEFNDIVNIGSCQAIGIQYTGTIYSVNLEGGEITCMFAQKDDLYNPMGLYKVYYPEIKKYYSLDKDDAKAKNAKSIANAEEQFFPLYEARKNAALVDDTKFLSITQILMASILTDADIIDIEATSASGKLQLKGSYTSKYVSDYKTGEVVDNSTYILTDSETIFDVYSKLSAVSMGYLLLLIVFFGAWGIGRAVLSPMADKSEGKQSSDKHIPYGFGLVLGVLLFFPVNDHESIENSSGKEVGQFEIMKTRYQDFEKSGYYLFSEWANDSAKVILDAEMNAIIDKSGIGTKEQIIDSYSSMILSEKLKSFYTEYSDSCKNIVYNTKELTNINNRTIYSGAENALFPISENWAYAASWAGIGGKDYYNLVPNGLVLQSGYKSGLNDSFYPVVSFSSCGKATIELANHTARINDFSSELKRLLATNGTDNKKIEMLKELITFQNALYRDWGYLSVLSLPVIKMQTEYIGGLYKSRNNEVLDELGKGATDGAMHTIMSSIPYMFVPGAGVVFNIMSENSGKIAAIAGITGVGGATAGVGGVVGGIIGGLAGTAASGAVGLLGAYNVAKTVLELTPIVGIVIIGLVRFIIIILKIFSFHFASLFLMPIMFARENIKALSNFSMKIFATMMELPIFVLSIWLAITANSLIHSVGDVFSKQIILGMLKNNEAQYAGVESNIFGSNGEWLAKMKIYFFDGLMEVAIAVFSVVIIYKLIITLHNTLFEILEIQGSQSLDNSIESMKNEAGGWGSRI